MKTSKILAALVSAATLGNTVGMTAFAADNNKNITTESYNYVALGDSIAAGFGLAGGDLTQDPALVITDQLLADPVKGAYPAIFTEYIEKLGSEKGYNVRGTNLASTAYRAADIEKTIKTPGYKGEFASGILESYVGEGASEVLSPYHDIYTKYLTEADLVSIQLGGNDIIMSIVPKMVYSDNPVLQAAGMSLMLTLFGTDTQTAIGGGLQIIQQSKDSITSEHFIEAASFMYNVKENANALVDESSEHVKSVVEAVKDINGDTDIALVGMFNPYRTAEESEEMEEDVFEVLGKIYTAAANAAAEGEDELTANGKQTANYIANLKNKVAKMNEIKAIMDKYNDAEELWEILNMISEYDDINEVKELAELINKSEGQPGKVELMALLVKYDDIAELQSVIDIIRNYDDLSELTDLMAVMAKYRTASEAAAENAIASEVAAPMAMQIAGQNADPQMRRLNENLKVVAEETGAVYVDVYGISPEDDFDPHPNANGHKEIAGILYDTMSERISDKMKTEETVTTTSAAISTTTAQITTTTAKTTSGTSAQSTTTAAKTTSGTSAQSTTTNAKTTSGTSAQSTTTAAKTTSGTSAQSTTTNAKTTSGTSAQSTTTTAKTTSGTSAQSTTTTTAVKANLWGDANEDGVVDLADAVLIMQSLANPDTYVLTEQGKANADVYQNGSGITVQDAAAIQKYLLRIIDKLPAE